MSNKVINQCGICSWLFKTYSLEILHPGLVLILECRTCTFLWEKEDNCLNQTETCWTGVKNGPRGPRFLTPGGILG